MENETNDVPVAQDTQDSPQDEVITLSKTEYEKLNQTLGSLKRENKDLKKSTTETKQTNSDELDWGKRAFLKSEGIEPEYHEWVHNQTKESGLPLDKLLSNPYFQSQIKERRDASAIKNAMPEGGRGSGENPKSSADYWVSRGEMPPNTPENFQLRRDVVNKRVQVEKNASRFSSSPIVQN